MDQGPSTQWRRGREPERQRFYGLWDFQQVNTSVRSKARGRTLMCSVFIPRTDGSRTDTKRCLEPELDRDDYFHLVVGQCSGQTWKMQHLINAAAGLLEKGRAPPLRKNGT